MSMGGLAPSTQLNARTPDFCEEVRAARESLGPGSQGAWSRGFAVDRTQALPGVATASGRGDRRSRSSGILAISTPGGGILVAGTQQHIDPPSGTGLDAVDRARERRRSERHDERREVSLRDWKDSHPVYYSHRASRKSLADERHRERDDIGHGSGNSFHHTGVMEIVAEGWTIVVIIMEDNIALQEFPMTARDAKDHTSIAKSSHTAHEMDVVLTQIRSTATNALVKLGIQESETQVDGAQDIEKAPALLPEFDSPDASTPESIRTWMEKVLEKGRSQTQNQIFITISASYSQ
ncbi:hypothetical protein BP5796_11331 [Coleophoma crateriformis]|uniref:Uncharacterized protein n=1 Tax=Coleophoma crateriformis TaxID=565419 RepID=A0A3D8QI37_9HELO|nr:hypothetical protein BP5796_11331 [Coleophoma crateriformis]